MPTPFSDDLIDQIRNRTVMGALGIDLVEASAERVVLALDVGPTVHQPYGYLHGGVSALLGETCASIGAGLAAGLDKQAFGIEINANHLRPVREGRIVATGVSVRQGRTIAVWDTRIVDEQDRLVCVTRCTVAIREAGDLVS